MVRALYFIMGLAMAAFAAAAPSSVVPRGDVPTIPHTDVKGFEEEAPKPVLKYQPWLKVSHGCVPWPAVNDKGEVSGGLKPTGSVSGKCGGNKGQVYTRTREYPNSFAIMYAWYFPKDQPTEGNPQGGQRHEWENAVVWLSDSSDNAKFLGVAWSRIDDYGGYGHLKAEDMSEGNLYKGRPRVEYFVDGVRSHQLKATELEGGEQPAIDWEYLTPEARDALNNKPFEGVDVPISDEHFEKKLRSASL